MTPVYDSDRVNAELELGLLLGKVGRVPAFARDPAVAMALLAFKNMSLKSVEGSVTVVATPRDDLRDVSCYAPYKEHPSPMLAMCWAITQTALRCLKAERTPVKVKSSDYVR